MANRSTKKERHIGWALIFAILFSAIYASICLSAYFGGKKQVSDVFLWLIPISFVGIFLFVYLVLKSASSALQKIQTTVAPNQAVGEEPSCDTPDDRDNYYRLKRLSDLHKHEDGKKESDCNLPSEVDDGLPVDF